MIDDYGQLNLYKSKEKETNLTFGVALPRWRTLIEEKGLRADTDVALFLLD